MGKKILAVRNWDRWQSYRQDRGCPPWIKVHRRLLQDENFVCLSDAEKGQLLCLWVLAADKNGVLPSDENMLFRLSMTEQKPNIERFIALGFLELRDAKAASRVRHDDADMTPKCHPRIEAETEAETEAEESRPSNSKLDGAHDDPLASYPLLAAAYPALDGALIAAHPKLATKRPKPQSAAWRKERDTLAKLVRLDNFSESEVIDALRWTLVDEPDAEFTWRAQLFAFAPLRKVKNGASKFAKIHAASLRAANKGNGLKPVPESQKEYDTPWEK